MIDDSETTWPLLDGFFAAELSGRTRATIARYQQVEARLGAMLSEDDLSRWLGRDGQRLLAAEREFSGPRAFWTLYGPDELVCVLPLFLSDEYLPPDPMVARSHVRLTDRLLRYLRRGRHIDMQRCACAF